MAKKRLKIHNKQGQEEPFDISAESVTLDNEGKTLGTKLAELEHNIEESGDGTYSKPPGGIPASDLAGDIPKDKLSQSVQTSLGKADTALQQETDPTVPAWAKASNPPAQVRSDWNQTNPNVASFIVNKPELAPVATSGDYNDLRNKPSIPEGADLSGLFANVSYNSTLKQISFLDKGNNVVGTLDASPFVRDGMVSGVSLTNGVLTITFNTDSGKTPIEITLGDLFNTDNYYTKTDADGKFVVKVPGKGLSTKDYTDADKAAVATISSKANAADVYSKSQVDTMVGGKQDALQFENTPTNGSTKMVNSGGIYTALQTLLGNITIDANGNWKIGNVPTNYSAKGMQGETVLVTGDPVTLVGMLVNDLFTPSAEKGTSAGVAVVIRNNVDILQAKVDELIDALAPLAFTGQGVAKTGLLDWSGNNVFFVTVGYDLKGVTASDNTDEDSHLVVGGNLQVALAANEYYSLIGATIEVKDDKNNSVSYTLNGNTLTINNLTRSVTIKVVGVLSGAHLVTIPAVEHLTFKDENDNVVSGELVIPDGDPLELTLVPDELWGIESCAVEMGGDEVADAYSWEFDENWERVHTISIEEVTGDVDIVPVMEDWNTFYSNVNALSGGRTLWNYYPSFMSPLFPLSTANNLLRITFDESRDNGYPHTMSFYNNRFCSSIRNTIYNTVNPRSDSDVYVVGNYGRISFNTKTKYNLLKCEDITENRTLFDGSTFNDPVFTTGVKYISRFLPKIITPNGFKQTAIQDTDDNTNAYGTTIWAYRSKAWSEDTSACSFVFALPKVANLTVYCGGNGGKLYTHDAVDVYTRDSHSVSGIQQLTSVNTAHTKAILLCNGSSSGTAAEKIAAAADALNNAYVKYGDKYVWWGKGVTVAQADIWEGAKVSGLPDFVEDVWTQNNE